MGASSPNIIVGNSTAAAYLSAIALAMSSGDLSLFATVPAEIDARYKRQSSQH